MRSKSFIQHQERNFYLLLFLTILGIFFINPFLRYPYDVYTHLYWIDIQDQANKIPHTRMIWHYLWAKLFSFFHINVTQIFLRAHIIHFTQILISFFSIFYFSKFIIRNLFTTISLAEYNYLAYWSTIIWFTVLSTYSAYYHQVWILWYSMNYQITLPLTLLITGLSISLFLETLSWKRKIIHIFMILLLSYSIIRIHAMEYIYYLMYMGVFALVHIDKLSRVWKKYIYYSIPLTFVSILGVFTFISFIKESTYRKIPLLDYLSLEKLPELLSKIHSKGTILTTFYNKASTTMNELIYLSLFLIFIMLILVLYRHYKNSPSFINIRLIIFLFITSFFIVIPLNEITGGIASLLTYTTVAYRFYFSTLLFLILPISIFYIFLILNINKLLLLNCVIIFTLIGTFFYSQYISETKNYYKNIISIKNAFDKEKMTFNLSKKEIDIIGEKLKYYESLNKTDKKEYYYARDDIAFVIKIIYRRPVLYHAKGTLNYLKSYTDHKKEIYHPILFEVPPKFPHYTRYK